MALTTTDVAVPVVGGSLNVCVFGDLGTARPVLAVHGITASSRSFANVARQLAPAGPVLAVDLRGRGASTGLAGPYGIAAHTDDLAAVLDHFGIDRVVVAGHSLGAFIAARFAELHSSRVERIVLIDGGLPLDLPHEVDPDAFMEATVGAAVLRLAMTFESLGAYEQFWREHPAVGPYWNDTFARYVAYDLVGVPPAMRSRVEEAPVRADGRDLLTDPVLARAIERISSPTHLVRVDRGLFDEPGGFVPAGQAEQAATRLAHLTVETIPGLNHYTVVMGDEGAAAVAAATSG